MKMNNKTTLYDEKVCQDKIKHVAGEKVSPMKDSFISPKRQRV